MSLDVDYGENLGLIRHELKTLAEARCLGLWRPIDEIRYTKLCERERDLLRKGQQGIR